MGLHGKGWIGLDRDGMGADGEAAAKRAKIESNRIRVSSLSKKTFFKA
jgi:hypothetical protein